MRAAVRCVAGCLVYCRWKKCQGFSFPLSSSNWRRSREQHRSGRDPVGQQPWNDVHSCHPAPPTCPGTSSCTCVARPRPELSFLGRSSRWGRGSTGRPSKWGAWVVPAKGWGHWASRQLAELRAWVELPAAESREGLHTVGCGESCTQAPSMWQPPLHSGPDRYPLGFAF